MGLTQRTIFILTVVFSIGFHCESEAQAPPLQHQELLNGIPLPTSMVFLPDGRALVTSLNGRVWITSDFSQLPITFTTWMNMDTVVNNSAEHGMLEILLDPDFDNNNYVYLYYSTKADKNRLSRFVHLGDTSSITTETVIYETQETFNGCCHIGGASAFKNDGTILLSVGDDFQPTLAQDMSSPFGKVHRINPDGSIPSDNPFYDTTPGDLNSNGVLKTIYASGIRNPFRGAHDPVTDDFLIGEVGSNDHSNAWEDTHRLSSGANFGWPFCGAVGRDVDGNCNDPVFDDPISTYAHNGYGASVTAGFFYRNGTWADWEGRYIYGDFVQGWMNYMEFDGNGNVVNEQPIIDTTLFPGLSAEFVVKMLQGPDGNIYYIILYDDFVTNTGSIHRLVNTPNQIPICDTIWATPNFGAGPTMLVEFDGSVTDPEGYPLTYTWIFDDGTPNGTTLNSLHDYTNYGTYNAELIVEDDEHINSCGQIEVTVGQAPIALITSPADSSLFQAGQTITFSGWFSDDGPISVSDVSWNVVFNHDTHVHPVTGAQGIDEYDLIIPTTGHDYTGNTWYTVTFTVTDDDGLQTSHSVRIFPEKQNLIIESIPNGLEIIVNSLPYLTPYSEDHAIGTELVIAVPNAQQCSNGDGYLFDQWAGGQPPIFMHTVAAVPEVLSAQFQNDGPCSHCGTALDFDGTNDIVSMDSLTLSGDVTIEFWLQLDPNISAQDAILGNKNDLSLDMSGGKLTLDQNGTVFQSSIIAAANAWHHYAIVRDAGNWSVYVDGVLDNNANTAGVHLTDMLITQLGRSFRPMGLDGSLDEVRIWQVARSASQIDANKDILVDPLDGDILIYWRFDQPPTSQNVLDLSANPWNGFLGLGNQSDSLDPVFFDPNGPMGASCTRDVFLEVKAFLEGPYNLDSLLMNDDLRKQGYIPLNEPYSNGTFPLVNAGGESTDFLALQTSGQDALVDWVVVELRDADDPTTVLQSYVGLLQRDGDIVSSDGASPLLVRIDRPDAHLAVRHRNHNGIMTQSPVSIGNAGTTLSVDFTSASQATYGTGARRNIGGDYCMWAGNSTGDQYIKYAGSGNDRDPILTEIGGIIPTAISLGYSNRDINLDGAVRYSGPNNDRDIILVNIGGNVPTAVKTEQLP